MNLSGGSGVGRFRGIYQKSVAGSVALPAVSVSTSGSSGGGSGDSGLDAILGPNTSSNTTSTAEDTTLSTTVVHLQTSKIIKDPFSTTVTTAHNVQAKRNKKNLTFNVVSSVSYCCVLGDVVKL